MFRYRTPCLCWFWGGLRNLGITETFWGSHRAKARVGIKMFCCSSLSFLALVALLVPFFTTASCQLGWPVQTRGRYRHFLASESLREGLPDIVSLMSQPLWWGLKPYHTNSWGMARKTARSVDFVREWPQCPRGCWLEWSIPIAGIFPRLASLPGHCSRNPNALLVRCSGPCMSKTSYSLSISSKAGGKHCWCHPITQTSGKFLFSSPLSFLGTVGFSQQQHFLVVRMVTSWRLG